MSLPIHLIWTYAGKELHGFDLGIAVWNDDALTFGPSFPGDLSATRALTLQSSALRGRSYDSLVNTSLYLEADADTLATIAGWIEVSFDGGVTYQPLTATPLQIPAGAILPGSADGVIGPFDIAHLTVRANIPAGFTNYQVLRWTIGVDCDVY